MELDSEGEEGALPDDKLYKLSKLLDARASGVRAMLRQRARERTSVVELGEGVTLGPRNIKGYRWIRDRKKGALESLMSLLNNSGEDVFDYFDVKGESLTKWLDDLPDPAKEIVGESVKETTRQSFITKKEATDA